MRLPDDAFRVAHAMRRGQDEIDFDVRRLFHEVDCAILLGATILLRLVGDARRFTRKRANQSYLVSSDERNRFQLIKA
jgi:hypothetical protein